MVEPDQMGVQLLVQRLVHQCFLQQRNGFGDQPIGRRQFREPAQSGTPLHPNRHRAWVGRQIRKIGGDLPTPLRQQVCQSIGDGSVGAGTSQPSYLGQLRLETP